MCNSFETPIIPLISRNPKILLWGWKIIITPWILHRNPILSYFINVHWKKLKMILRSVTSHCSPFFPIVSHCLKNNRPYLTKYEYLGLQIWHTCFFGYLLSACQVSLVQHAPFSISRGGLESTPPRLATAEKSPGKVGLGWTICLNMSLNWTKFVTIVTFSVIVQKHQFWKMKMIHRRVTSHCPPFFPIVSHCLKNNWQYFT